MKARALAAAWLAFMAGLIVGGEIGDMGSFVLAGLIGAGLVAGGFAAAWRSRTLPTREPAQRFRLAVWALAFGAVLGLVNLAANWIIARGAPAIRDLLVERMRALDPRDALIASPIVEEVLVRLFLLSVIAWGLLRVTRHAGAAFGTALVGSAVCFALLHLARPFPGDPALATYYRVTLLAKYTLAGIPLGWVFWRWGLPYSILCHMAANAAHLALQSRVF